MPLDPKTMKNEGFKPPIYVVVITPKNEGFGFPQLPRPPSLQILEGSNG